MTAHDKIQGLFLSLLPDAADKELILRQTVGFGADDWRQLFSLSRGAGLFPMFYAGISRSYLPGLTPEIANENKTLFLFNLKKNAQTEKEMLVVLSCLLKNGIAAMTLKGPALARYIHGDLSCRQASCDIDILVLPGEKEKAAAALKEIGYRFNVNNARQDFFYKFRSSIMLQKETSETEAVNLDLHWGFRDKFIHNHINEFWGNARRLPYLDAQVTLPSDEDLFLFLVLTAFSDFDFVQPKYLYDIHRLLASRCGQLDWERIQAQAQRHGLTSASFFSLLLSVAIFKTEVPEKLQKRLRPSFLKFKICSLYLTKRNILFYRQKMMESYLWRYALCSYLFSPGLISAVRLMYKKTFISIDEVVASQPGSGLNAQALYLRRLLKPFGAGARNS